MRKGRLLWHGVLLAFLPAFFAMGSTTYAQPTAPVDVVRAFLSAINNDDKAAGLALIDPAGMFVADAGTPDEAHDTLQAFADEIFGRGFHVTINTVSETSPGVVAVEFAVSGGDIPELPHPFTIAATATVSNGKIVSWSEAVTAQTLEDLQALAASSEPVGMPRTGAADLSGLLAGLAMALLSMAAGVLARRAHNRNH